LPPALLAAGTLALPARRARRLLPQNAGAAVARWMALPRSRWSVAVAAVTGLLSWYLFSHALQATAGGGLTAAANVWGDWGVHTSYVQSFLLGHNLPPTDSLEAGTALRYPFLVDFQPALLGALGQNLAGALDMPSFVVGWAAMMLIFHLGLRVTRRPAAASLALALVLFGGGLGFVGAYGDGCQQLGNAQPGFDAAACTHLSYSTPGAVAGFLGHIPTQLTHLPRYYDGQDQANPPLPDLQWYAPLVVYWLPQRDFAYGMGLVSLGLILLWEAVRRRRRALALGAGVVVALLPFFNPIGYLFAGLSGLWWTGRRGWWPGLARFAVPAAVLGLPQLWFVVSGPHGSSTGPLGSNLFPALDLGWLSHATVACTAAQYRAGADCSALFLAGTSPLEALGYVGHTLSQPSFYGGLAGFWISNTGAFTLLALLAAALAVLPGRLGTRLRRLRLMAFWAPAWLAFAIGNVVVTQPWNWDNTKLLSYWYLGAAIPVAWLLTAGPRRRVLSVLAGVAVVTLMLSGVLTQIASLTGLSDVLQTPPSGATATLAGSQEAAVGRAVRERTAPGAVFLTEGQPNDPVTTLAGRTVVLGYYGWLWSYGQPLAERYRAVQTMYAGCTSGRPCQVGTLLRRYRVSYVEFEPGNYNQLQVNLAWYQSQRLPVVVRTPLYVIFKVTSLWAPTSAVPSGRPILRG
ncbi:MAG: hypothetical protein WBU92_09150, partial [Candidatus Dormiibacterota bacterium]